MNVPPSLFAGLLTSLLICSPSVLAQPGATAPNQKKPSSLPFPMVTPDKVVQLLPPFKPLSLHLRGVTIAQALAELQKQSGVEIEVYSGGFGYVDTTFSLDLETNSFWEAAQAIINGARIDAHLVQDSFSDMNTWRLSGATPRKYLLSGVGPFAIGADELTYSYSRAFIAGTSQPTENINDNNEGRFAVSFASFADARIPLVGPLHLNLTRATDERGYSLLTDDKGDSRAFNFSLPRRNSDLRLALKVLKPKSKILTHLEGDMTYVVATKFEKWKIEDVLNAKDTAHEFQSGGQTFRFRIEKAQDGVNPKLDIKVELVSAQPKQPQPDDITPTPLSHSIVLQGLSLLTADGKKFTTTNNGGTGAQTQLSLSAAFKPSRETGSSQTDWKGPFKLSIELPIEVVQTKVPFSFTNLPLP